MCTEKIIQEILDDQVFHKLGWNPDEQQFDWDFDLAELPGTEENRAAVRKQIEESVEYKWAPTDVETIIAVAEYGTSSGTWMPCVAYRNAEAVMAEFGDEILEFIFERGADGVPPKEACVAW